MRSQGPLELDARSIVQVLLLRKYLRGIPGTLHEFGSNLSPHTSCEPETAEAAQPRNRQPHNPEPSCSPCPCPGTFDGCPDRRVTWQQNGLGGCFWVMVLGGGWVVEGGWWWVVEGGWWRVGGGGWVVEGGWWRVGGGGWVVVLLLGNG